MCLALNREGRRGYQESLAKIDCLAEVVGIDQVIRKSEEVNTLEYLICYCALRVRCDLC